MKKIIALSCCVALVALACGEGEGSADLAPAASPSTSLSPGGSPEPPEGTDSGSPQEASPSPAPTTQGDPPIEVTSPRDGEEVANRFVLAGEANVFEANVRYRLRTEGGRVLVDHFTTATCGSGCRGGFRTRIRYDLSRKTDAVLEVFEESAEDGSELHKVELNLILLP